MNRVCLVGRITKDLELRTTPSNNSVCQFNLAVNRIGVKEGQQDVDFINCVVWNKTAENLAKYQGKGSQVAIEGNLRVEKFEHKGEIRFKTYVLVQNLSYLDSKKDNKTTEVSTEQNKVEEDPYQEFSEEVEITEEDLPF